MVKSLRLSANTFALLIAALTTAAIFMLNSCGEPAPPTTADNLTGGRQLSLKYCVSCHRYPSPALLDKTTWEHGVLPQMAAKVGIQQEMGQYYADNQSVICLADWQKIIAYYKSAAPQKLFIPKQNAPQDWAVFTLKRPIKADTNNGPAMTTMIKFNPFDKQIYTGDAGNNLYAWDKYLQKKLIQKMPSPVTDATFFNPVNGKANSVFTCIGVLPPNDYLKGSLVQLTTGKNVAPVTLTDSLPRPVQTAAGDFNKDGLTDYIVCGYGNNTGGLYLVQQQANHTFKRKVIRAVPGAIQLQTGDFNNDGWPDVMCLFAQGDEGVWLFLNDKKGGFTAKNLLRFPPVYGTNSFQLVDMNGDGKKDIIYTCGDNNDYSSILKPYHGVYIFTNMGNWQFKQTFFYHINGASKVMAADFNGDGHMDMATIAFFPDFKDHPTEGFIYFEQAKPGGFNPHEVPVNKYGRWIAMEVADIDGDGDQDIVLGNFSIYGDKLINQKDFKPNWDMHLPIIVLENKTRKQKH